MSVIEIQNLTKDYGAGRGIFNINLNVEQGETVGFAGTNGSGKTTTIRNILGFIKPTSGVAKVNGLNSWEKSSEVLKSIGYVPGEIAFPDLATGIDFLKCQAEFYGIKAMSRANELIEKLQLDPRANLKRMSKGMKQKTALVAALFSNAPVLVLDEPTTGLDPLMRLAFLDIIKEEKQKGKTIFMSSHMFEELETTCDRVALINDGKLIDVADMQKIRNPEEKQFKIEFNEKGDFERFKTENFKLSRVQPQYNQVTLVLKKGDSARLLKTLCEYNVKFMNEIPNTLEKHFKNVLIDKKLAEKNVNGNKGDNSAQNAQENVAQKA